MSTGATGLRLVPSGDWCPVTDTFRDLDDSEYPPGYLDEGMPRLMERVPTQEPEE